MKSLQIPSTKRKKVDNFIKELIKSNPELILMQYNGDTQLAVKALHTCYNKAQKKSKKRRKKNS